MKQKTPPVVGTIDSQWLNLFFFFFFKSVTERRRQTCFFLHQFLSLSLSLTHAHPFTHGHTHTQTHSHTHARTHGPAQVREEHTIDASTCAALTHFSRNSRTHTTVTPGERGSAQDRKKIYADFFFVKKKLGGGFVERNISEKNLEISFWLFRFLCLFVTSCPVLT